MKDMVDYLVEFEKVLKDKSLSEQNRMIYEYFRSFASLIIALSTRAPQQEIGKLYKETAMKWRNANRVTQGAYQKIVLKLKNKK